MNNTMSRCLYSMLYIISFTIKNHLLPRYGNSPKHSDKNRTGNEKLTNLSFPVFFDPFPNKRIKNTHKTTLITISIKKHSESKFSDKIIIIKSPLRFFQSITLSVFSSRHGVLFLWISLKLSLCKI